MYLPLVLHTIAAAILGYCLFMKIKHNTYREAVMAVGVVFQVLGAIAAIMK